MRGEIWVDAQGTTTPPGLQQFPPSGPPNSFFMFQSVAGDPVGRGASVNYTVSNARFQAWESPNRPGVNISIDEPIPGGQFWRLDLSAPSGLHLMPGTYDNAASYILTPPGVPGLSLSGNGVGCSVTGKFVVLEAVYGPQGEVYRSRATFEQYCNGFATPLRGEIYIVADPWR